MDLYGFKTSSWLQWLQNNQSFLGGQRLLILAYEVSLIISILKMRWLTISQELTATEWSWDLNFSILASQPTINIR